jgi:D-aminopeptidase
VNTPSRPRAEPKSHTAAGTGTTCFGWKGGIGTASRQVPEAAGGYLVGALVQSNFGRAQDLIICGLPAGRISAGNHKKFTADRNPRCCSEA